MCECQLAKWERCCCTCKHHLKDFSHPCTDGGRVTVQRGWVCANPELFDGARYVHSGWTEHGICEVHTTEIVTTDA